MKKEKSLSYQLFDRYMKSFDKCSDEQIIVSFNKEAGNCGWGTARASYLGALHKQLEIRNFDYSEIGDKESMSLKSMIKLEGKVIRKIPEKPVKDPNSGLWKVDFDEKEKDGFKITRLC